MRSSPPIGRWPTPVPYNGDQEWTAVREVSELFVEAPRELARYRPRMPYLVIDEERLGEADLESLRNLAAALFRLERSQGPADMFQVMDALAEWLRDRDDLLRNFLAWITHVLLPRHEAAVGRNEEAQSLEELKIMLQEQTQRTWSQIAYEKGTEKGKKEGEKKGHAHMLETQLEAKFGPLDDSVRPRLYEATSEELLRWGTRLLKAESLAEVFRESRGKA